MSQKKEEEMIDADEVPCEDAPSVTDLSDVESLQKALAEEREKSDKYLTNWQRSQADFSNFKKRNEQEKAEIIKFSNSLLMGELLPVLDDFERALDSLPPELAGVPWVEGIDLVYRKLLSAMEAHGLAGMDVEGQDFDPNFHQAVFYEEGGEEDKIIEDLQKGYMLHDRLLRPSMVKVGKGDSESGDG